MLYKKGIKSEIKILNPSKKKEEGKFCIKCPKCGKVNCGVNITKCSNCGESL
ncbi:unnamed protein product [marine sediment metagenome]|uniref:Uncharacterized protein n=1 Tax=marine sediment metagenome TaxID=412755 RepID=X1CGZ8_9ZZZZ